MSQGQGSFQTNQRVIPAPAPGPPGPPFLLTSANNGLSVDPISGKIVLGQDIGALGDPAQLLSIREIPLFGFQVFFRGQNVSLTIDDIAGDPEGLYFNSVTLGQNLLAIDAQNGRTDLNDPNGALLTLEDSTQTAQFSLLGGQFFLLDRINGIYEMGDIAGVGSGNKLVIDDTIGQEIRAVVSGDFRVEDTALNSVGLIDTSGGAAFGELNSQFANAGSQLQVFGGSRRLAYTINNFTNFLFEIDATAGNYRLGDRDGIFNGNFLDIDDTVSQFKITNTAANAAILINGVLGFTGTVTPVTTITVDGGIVTNVA